ncbi:hypothetical protein D9M71_623860 [compost metagenome]
MQLQQLLPEDRVPLLQLDEVRRPDLQQHAGQVGVGVIGARQSVDHRQVAEPTARVVEMHHALLPLTGHGAQANGAFQHAIPALRVLAATAQALVGHQRAQLSAGNDVLAQRFRQTGEPGVAQQHGTMPFRQLKDALHTSVPGSSITKTPALIAP